MDKLKGSRAPLTVVDLFAGVGGISQGFMRARGLDGEPLFDVRLLVDNDKEAAHSFKSNYPGISFLPKDIRQVTSKEILELAGSKRIDVIVGGPPCQGFSSVGKRILDDKRNELLKDFMALSLDLKPMAILMENVPNVLGSAHAPLVSEISELLAENEYTAKTVVSQATDYGVPQIRRRAFLLALRRGFKFLDPFFPPATQEKGKPINVEEAIGDLPPLKAGEGEDALPFPCPPFSNYQKDRRRSAFLVFNHISRNHNPAFLEKISIIPEGGGNRDLDPEVQFSDNYFSQAYARLSRKEPAYTVTAHFMNPGSGRYIHYRDRRSITPREAARLQGFDDSFVFHGTSASQARQIGNAVPPLMAKAWAEQIARTIGHPAIVSRTAPTRRESAGG